MIAVDTNLLVYAHRSDLQPNVRALEVMDKLANGTMRWTIPWPCVHEFIGTVTRKPAFVSPSTMEEAFAFVRELERSDSFVGYIGEGFDHLALLSGLCTSSGIWGAKIHDARIAAICIAHGVTELWTADRDFLLFPDLRVRNPLVSSINE